MNISKAKAEELENALMDYLMDGEATLQEACFDLKVSTPYLHRIAGYLQAQGLVDSRVCHTGSRIEIRWFMQRTRRAPQTETARQAA
ncbi:hypothetical protein [Panacagrimonas sp.]|uniref:hypothetical protein n=1 Tax=Panacagrimonas sp. TaxID=2480088 RepID=UPI003B529B24